MIKYNLKCDNDHEFESWFSDSNEFDKLNKQKLLECIYCSSKKIQKSIMAPMISGAKLKDVGDELFDKDSLKQRKNLLNLTKIQSLPVIEKPGKYAFFVDLIFDDINNYLKAKKILSIMASHFKVLGEYSNGL